MVRLEAIESKKFRVRELYREFLLGYRELHRVREYREIYRVAMQDIESFTG